jgi:hypothetical protein
MGLLRIVGLGFLALFMLGLALLIAGYIQQASQPPQPQLVMNIPAGFTYEGPQTTALAGYYCIASINSSNGYSIQLNAELNNGEWVQDAYIVPPNEQSGLNVNVWSGTSSVTAKFMPATTPCAWLIISIENGVVYIGYSLDGENVIWYASYPVGDTYIVPGAQSNLVLAGYAYGLQAQLNNGTLVYLTLYYWNGTTWEPAPIKIIQGLEGTLETVNNAYVFTSGTCGGVVSWPNPVNETMCPTPAFKP